MNRTTVDWVGFRTSAEPVEALEVLRAAFGYGDALGLRTRESGWQGYDRAGDVVLDDMHVGLMAWGGEHQRDWVMVSISGRGCEWIPDWDRAQDAIGALPCMGLRRVDLALTTQDGSVSHELVVGAYEAGQFITRGRPPAVRHITSQGGHNSGRTVEVGSRDQAKFFRGYEKGRELLKNHPAGTTHIDGVRVEDIYRCEVEYKPKNSPLPEDLIDRRDQYFAGAYPFLGQLMRDVDPEIFVQRRERGPQLDLDAALAQIRQQYGTTLFTALVAHHGDFMAVWDKIVGNRHNAALVEAGVLLVDHGEAVRG